MLIFLIPVSSLLVRSPCLGTFPVCAHLLDLLLIVELGVVVLANATDTFPERQVLRVNGHTVVIAFAAGADKLPSAFLLLEIETGGIGEEEEGEEHAGKTEPWDDVEFLQGSDVVVHNSGSQGTKFAARGREAMGCGTDRCGVDLGCDKECHGVGAELVEEGGEEVHGLE